MQPAVPAIPPQTSSPPFWESFSLLVTLPSVFSVISLLYMKFDLVSLRLRGRFTELFKDRITNWEGMRKWNRRGGYRGACRRPLDVSGHTKAAPPRHALRTRFQVLKCGGLHVLLCSFSASGYPLDQPSSAPLHIRIICGRKKYLCPGPTSRDSDLIGRGYRLNCVTYNIRMLKS